MSSPTSRASEASAKSAASSKSPQSIKSSSASTASSTSRDSDTAASQLSFGDFFENNRTREASSLELQDIYKESKGEDDVEEINNLKNFMIDEIEQLEKLAIPTTIINTDSRCIRNISNWAKVDKQYMMDKPTFDPVKLKSDIKKNSPKLDALLKKIVELDAADMREHGRKFKHFIFSDIKTYQGAKIIASALISHGYNLGMKAVPVATTKKNKGGNMGRRVVGGAADSADSADNDENKSDVKYKLSLLSDDQLLETKGDNFYFLSSASIFGQPLRVDMKKAILRKFNQRPDNVYGNLARIIVMDSGFKEGIDLFDIKYVHIYEPQTSMADQKQVIGRGTRTCGQKGLKFHPKQGWPLHVYKYDLEIPDKYSHLFLNAKTAFDLFLKSQNVDIRLFNLTEDIEKVAIYGSADYELNANVHSFGAEDVKTMESAEKMHGGALVRKHEAVRGYVRRMFGQYSWDKVKMENLCGYEGPESMRSKGGRSGCERSEHIRAYSGENIVEKSDFGPGIELGGDGNIIKGGANVIKFSPTQDFVRNFFVPNLPLKGMLLYQSVGTGKTCTAIANATTQFEPAGYTILWVTRTTLKNDIWKNMFEQICHEQIRSDVERGVVIPDVQAKRMRMLSKAWSIRPMSYKQFSNLVLKRNAIYNSLVKRNGAEDPLHKTLIIIDEAHKLFGGADLSSIERPDTDALHTALMNSYRVSGQDSVRLLLMTATPITQDPMELVKLLNLCKLPDKQIPCDMETFTANYLDEDGRFTQEGRARFLDEIAGHISYLNREGDMRQFAKPILHTVNVPLVDEKLGRLVDKYDKPYIKSVFDGKNAKYLTAIEGATKDLESFKVKQSNLKFLEKPCEAMKTKKIKTVCNKLVRQHKKMIMEDVANIKKTTKIQLDDAKLAFKELKGELKLANVGARIPKETEANFNEYKNFKSATYSMLKDQCVQNVNDTSSLEKIVNKLPIADVLRRGSAIIAQKKAEMENQKKENTLFAKNTLASLRKSIKASKNDIDKEMAKNALKTAQAEIVASRGKLMENIAKKTKILDKLDKTFKKKYKKYITAVRKTAKKRIKEVKKEKLAAAKAEKKAKEAAKVIESIEDLDGTLRDIVEKHKDMLDVDVELAVAEDNELAKVAEEKEAAKAAKEAEKVAKAAAKAEKDAASAALKAEKAAKAAAKLDEKAAKEAAKVAAKAEKERVLAAKVAAKAEKDRVLAAKVAVKAEKERVLAEKKVAKAAKDAAKVNK